MKITKNFFDDFTYHARAMPIMVMLMPVIILGVLGGVVQDSWIEGVVLSSIVTVFLTITSKMARNLGKKYEIKMFKQLGGMPTTIVQRFSDNTFDEITKQRYHKKLNQFEGLSLPVNKSVETDDDDQQYISAANILRNYANSNRDKEHRVYQELKEYNFWRNLYGTKKIALAIYFVIVIREMLVKETISLKDMFLSPYPNYIPIIVMMLAIVFVAFFVNQKTVKGKAFDYAKALIEVCERIPTDAS